MVHRPSSQLLWQYAVQWLQVCLFEILIGIPLAAYLEVGRWDYLVALLSLS